MSDHPTITEAKALALKYRKRGIVILSFTTTVFAATSYGMTRKECAEMGGVVEQISAGIEDGSIDVHREIREQELHIARGPGVNEQLLAACELVIERAAAAVARVARGDNPAAFDITEVVAAVAHAKEAQP